jgi:predicted AAA+ superfamily ATPase
MVKIAEIVNQNPWWKQGKEFIQYDRHIKRAQPIFFERKNIMLKRGGVYILRGPRQVGKTTYLKDTIKKLIESGKPANDILYLSLDFFTSRREMRNALEYFMNLRIDAKEVYIFLDEITSIEDWNLELKFIADQGITERGVVVATGSSAVKLKDRGELLPGRGLEGNEYYIRPLSFREFVLQTIDYICIVDRELPDDGFKEALKRLKEILKESFIDISYSIKNIKNEIQKIIPYKKELGYLFQIYLIIGGFPLVIDHYIFKRFVEKRAMVDSDIGEIFIRDILGDLSRLQKQETITVQLLKAILQSYGSRYSFSRIAKEIERTHITTIEYLEYLEESFITFILYAFDFNKKAPKWKGDKKVYFFDPFIFHSVKSYIQGEEIWNIIEKTTEDEELQSKLVEGVIITHLLAHQEEPFIKRGRTFLWNYYDKSGREIDAVIKGKDGYTGIEVKFRAQIGEIKTRNIAPLNKFIILSKEDVGEKDNTMIIPVDIFLALLPFSKQNL